MSEMPAGHDVQACGKCQFVGHQDFIVVTPQQRAEAGMTIGKALRARIGLYDPEDAIVFLGRYSLPRWVGHSAFWLFTCPGCLEQSVDYLHGHRLYLKCSSCGLLMHVYSARFYEESGLPQPPSPAQEAAHLKALRRQLSR
jgi:ribosomal protein S27E